MRRLMLSASVLAAVAIAARLPDVWRLALSQDEVASARILREPTLLSALHRVVRTESTPPLWYALGWVAHQAGIPVVEVRLLSVACGGLLVIAVFIAASMVVSRPCAMVAGALVAFGYEPVFHGAELRAYELLALLATALALVLLQAARRPRRSLDVALAAVVFAGLLTHYFFVFSLLAAVAWLWLEPRARALRRRASVAIAAGGALAALWLPAFLVQYRQDRFWWIGAFRARAVLVTPLRFFTPYGVHHLLLGLLVAAIVCAGAVALAHTSAEGRLLAALAVTPIVIAAALWASGVHIYAVRNLIGAAPFAAIAVAAAGARLPHGLAVAAAAAVVASAAALWMAQTTSVEPRLQSVAERLVAEGWRPSDPIAVFGNFFTYRAPLEWYLPQAPRLDVAHPNGRACETLFVIEGNRVTRLDDAKASWLRRLRRATLLASMHDTPRCVELSRDRRLEPLA